MCVFVFTVFGIYSSFFVAVGEEMVRLADINDVHMVAGGNGPVGSYSPPDGDVQSQVMACDDDL